MRAAGFIAVVWLSACAAGRRTIVDETAADAAVTAAGSSRTERTKPDAATAMPREIPSAMSMAAMHPPASLAADAGKPLADAGQPEPARVDASAANAGEMPGSEPDAAMNAAMTDEPALDVPVPPAESECTFVEVRARKDALGTPFPIAADAGDLSVCFAYDFKFDAPTQGLAFYPVKDNKSVVHHLVLYMRDSLDMAQPIVDCSELTYDAVVAAAWAPGLGDWYLPKHVGFELARGRFILEVHYSNFTGQAATDSSGIRICTTHQLRPETASVSWLGNQLFFIPPHSNNFEVQGRCTPSSKRPIHVLRAWPHMHMLGRRMSMLLDRADGTHGVIFDEPFSFGNQQLYDTPLILMPGDSMLTTCYFDNPNDYPVSLGLRSVDEMCHNFVVAYPAGALSSPGPLANSCLGLP